MTVAKQRLAWFKGLVAKHSGGDLQDFSGKVGIDRSTVSLIYNGKRDLTDRYAIRVSNKLHADPPADMNLAPVAKDNGKEVDHEEQLAGMVEQLLGVVTKLSDRLDLQTNMINSLSDAVRSNSQELKELREALIEAKAEQR